MTFRGRVRPSRLASSLATCTQHACVRLCVHVCVYVLSVHVLSVCKHARGVASSCPRAPAPTHKTQTRRCFPAIYCPELFMSQAFTSQVFLRAYTPHTFTHSLTHSLTHSHTYLPRGNLVRKVALHVVAFTRIIRVSLHPMRGHDTPSCAQPAVAAMRTPHPLVAGLTRDG